ncbi:hypothetical protein DFH09DRAFT_1098628 [Mycena vulgaris]|nr:hypothetical protein DFH09DRAFT_1098628 [Mycena vulgaris]
MSILVYLLGEGEIKNTQTPALEISKACVLSLASRDRYRRFENFADRAIAVLEFREALNLTQKDVPEVLEGALRSMQESVALTLDGHPVKSLKTQDLADNFSTRYHRFKDPRDPDAAYSHWHESFKLLQSWPKKGPGPAVFGGLSFSQTTYPQAGFSLLPEILWIDHPVNTRHAAIRRLDITAATSTATEKCNNLLDLTSAIELLEEGLAMTCQQILELQTDFGSLPSDRADHFHRLSEELYRVKSTDLRKVATRRKDLLENIRKQPSLKYFLLPEPHAVPCHASRGGSTEKFAPPFQYTDSGGLCIQQAVWPTTEVHIDDNRGITWRYLELALDAYCFSSVPSFRISDCAPSISGITNFRASSMASKNGRPAPPTTQFIYSYAVTLGSLIDANEKKSQIIVAKGVQGEVDRILSIIETPQVRCLAGEQATCDAVTQQLQECSWVHLACRGIQNLAKPTKSHLLYCGNLELETTLRMPLVNASAISTLWSMDDQDGPLIAERLYSHLFCDGRQSHASDTAEAPHLAVAELKKKRKVPTSTE